MKRLLAIGLGLGWLPLAPGSWGSLPPAVLFGALAYFGVPGPAIAMVLVVLAAAAAVVCVKYSPASIAATGNEDPNEVVTDEIAGQSLTFLGVSLLAAAPLSHVQAWLIAGLGFFIYRAFDTIKCWPIHRFEELPQGWGILTDDLMAAVYAGIVLAIVTRLWVVP